MQYWFPFSDSPSKVRVTGKCLFFLYKNFFAPEMSEKNWEKQGIIMEGDFFCHMEDKDIFFIVNLAKIFIIFEE